MNDDRSDELTPAEAYETSMVPALFREWPPRVLAAARVAPGDRILDVACGTGVLARAALERVGSEGSVAGLDLNPGMLAVAERLEPAVEWREGSAEALPWADGTFDAVVSQFGLMFFPDRRRALSEMVRVVGAGGRLSIAVWDALERTPAYAAEVAIIERVSGRRAAAPLTLPFALGDPAALRALFEEAGIGPVTIERHVGQGRFPDVRSMVAADVLGWLPMVGVQLPEDEVEQILAESEEELREFVAEDGSVAFEMPALIVSFGVSAPAAGS